MKGKIWKGAIAVFVAVMMIVQTAFAAGCDVTSYAFNQIAGTISGDTITVNVPYSTVTTYWNHTVKVSDGASFRTSAITKIDDKHYTGKLTVTGSDGSSKEYTVNINKNDYVAPEIEIKKAKAIKTNGARIPVTINYNDGDVTSVNLVYYTKKNSKRNKRVTGTGNVDVELTGLSSSTKYYYYLELETPDKTYTTSSKSFTTKDKKETGTNSSKTNNSSSSTNKTGTNATGPGTSAKEDATKKNTWSLENGKWYYYGADGFTKIGWFQVGDKWYYVERGTNELAMNTWKKIGGIWYMFDGSGAMVANNWVLSGGKWYWMGASGSMLTSQEIDVNGKHYLLFPDGTCADNVMIMKDGRFQYYKAGAQGLAINEEFIYNGQVLHADVNGYVY